jgi:hypothetical protein
MAPEEDLDSNFTVAFWKSVPVVRARSDANDGDTEPEVNSDDE